MKSKECDVEGSGVDDCPSEDSCCAPAACNALFNPSKNPDKRCCTRDERNETPRPNYCMLCTECCDDSERRITPLPDHCSKCRRCTNGKYNMSKNE